MIKEKFLNLVNACKNDRDMLDIIESDMRALGEYVYAVHIMETSLPIIRVNYEGQELRYRVEKLDHNRRTHHERAIMGVKRMNRFAEMEGIEKIFTGDVNNRYAIADFCRDTTVEMFDDRTGRSLSLVHPSKSLTTNLKGTKIKTERERIIACQTTLNLLQKIKVNFWQQKNTMDTAKSLKFQTTGLKNTL